MKRIVFLMFIMLSSVVLCYGQASLYTTSHQRMKDLADRLNTEEKYQDAYLRYSMLVENLESLMTSDGLTAEELSTEDFLHYMNALTGVAETAYMTDHFTALKDVCEKKRLLLERRAAVNPLPLDISEKQQAYVNKESGNCYYGLYNDKTSLRIADSLYLAAEKSLENDPSAIPLIKMERAQLYYKYGEYEKAYEVLEEFSLWQNEIGYIYSEAFALCCARIGNFEEALNIINYLIEMRSGQHSARLPELYRKKAKILMLQYDKTGMVDWKEVKNYYSLYVKDFLKEKGSELRLMTSDQREQHWLAMHDFLYDCYRLEGHATELLYDLALYSKGFLLEYKNRSARQYKWTDIRKALPPESCCVEFVQYKGKDDVKELGAMVITRNCKMPEFVHVSSVDNIKKIRSASLYTIADLLDADGGDIANSLYGDSSVYHHFWTPELMKAIGNARKIYFAPDGILHQVAIEYMMPDTLKQCYRLSSTRLLVTGKKSTGKKVLLCGGIDYQTAKTVLPTAESETDNDIDAFRLLSQSSPYISFLPGTEKEVNSIYDIRSHDTHTLLGDTLLKGSMATDERFCKLASGNYSIVHLATHGFFIGKETEGTDLKPVMSDNSMSKSGLVFAGAAGNIGDSSFDARQADGILTAREISKQQFQDIDLIILSACQTALGYVTSDGVYGIQRGLKAAGVNMMILSLWSVDDNSTCLFMQFLHEELNKDRDVHRAFMKARKRLLSESIVTNRFNAATMSHSIRKKKMDEPQYADAFILIDAL